MGEQQPAKDYEDENNDQLNEPLSITSSIVRELRMDSLNSLDEANEVQVVIIKSRVYIQKIV